MDLDALRCNGALTCWAVVKPTLFQVPSCKSTLGSHAQPAQLQAVIAAVSLQLRHTTLDCACVACNVGMHGDWSPLSLHAMAASEYPGRLNRLDFTLTGTLLLVHSHT